MSYQTIVGISKGYCIIVNTHCIVSDLVGPGVIITNRIN